MSKFPLGQVISSIYIVKLFIDLVVHASSHGMADGLISL
jgi:hypothetical protein